jgi:hypothetical protein
MEKNGSAQELTSISGLFISSQEEKEGTLSQLSEPEGDCWNPSKEDCDIEESVTVRKRIAYPGTRTGQEKIKKNLFDFLKNGYSISRIELKKTSETFRPGNRIITSEEIALYMKQDAFTKTGEL